MVEKIYYKYRKFSDILLSNLLNETIYFASPNQLNDPFEGLSYLQIDTDIDDLEYLFKSLSSTTDSDNSLEIKFREIKKECEYIFRNQDDNQPYNDIYKKVLKYNIEEIIRMKYSKGIFSISSKYNCPLLWSHYGDEHKGICIGYSIPLDTRSSLFKVEYSNNKSIKASDLLKMINRDYDAQERVEKTILRTKSKHWSYEKEWRLIGAKGLSTLKIELKEVIFGIKCSEHIKELIVRILQDGIRDVSYFRMIHEGENFLLKRKPYDAHAEILSHPPQSMQHHRKIMECFGPVPDNE